MKYGNKKIQIDGITFDSRKEAQRYSELKLMQRAGLISGLELQKEFVLIPAQFETVITKAGKTKQVCIERAVKYKADFAYMQNGEQIVEDTKGFKTKDYIIKRKLMLWVYGIKIVEV